MNIMRNYTKPTVTLDAFLEEHNLSILMRRGEDRPREYNACVENHSVLDGARILQVNGRGATEHDSLVDLCNLLSGRRLTLCIHGGRGIVIQVPELIHTLEPEQIKIEPLKCPQGSCDSSDIRYVQVMSGLYQYRCYDCGCAGPQGADEADARERFSRLKMDRIQTP